jgi:hypothetical protein
MVSRCMRFLFWRLLGAFCRHGNIRVAAAEFRMPVSWRGVAGIPSGVGKAGNLRIGQPPVRCACGMVGLWHDPPIRVPL